MARSRKTEFFVTALPVSLTQTSNASSGDRRWKALTTRGNEAFAEKRWREAEKLYGEALAEAGAIFCAWRAGRPASGADPAPMLIVATANLAECWLQDGQVARAADHLVALRRRLCDTVDCKAATPDVRDQCFRHLRPLVDELVDKLPRAGWSEEQMAQEIEQTKVVALRYLARSTTTH